MFQYCNKRMADTLSKLEIYEFFKKEKTYWQIFIIKTFQFYLYSF